MFVRVTLFHCPWACKKVFFVCRVAWHHASMSKERLPTTETNWFEQKHEKHVRHACSIFITRFQSSIFSILLDIRMCWYAVPIIQVHELHFRCYYVEVEARSDWEKYFVVQIECLLPFKKRVSVCKTDWHSKKNMPLLFTIFLCILEYVSIFA